VAQNEFLDLIKRSMFLIKRLMFFIKRSMFLIKRSMFLIKRSMYGCGTFDPPGQTFDARTECPFGLLEA
jgi:hypothetical protein